MVTDGHMMCHLSTTGFQRNFGRSKLRIGFIGDAHACTIAGKRGLLRESTCIIEGAHMCTAY
jgi:hypothetical protein